jgi:hypothetical protein
MNTIKQVYNANKSLIKQASREKLFYILQGHWNSKKPKTILTLPNTEFYLEQQLHRLYKGSKIVGYEKHKGTFKKALKHKPGYVKLVNDDVFNAAVDKPYDFIWLDFCNRMHDDFVNKIIKFISKVKFNPNAVLVFTFAARGTSDKSTGYSEFYTNYKYKGFPNHLNTFLSRPAAQVQYFNYANKDLNARATTMTVFIFKLT